MTQFTERRCLKFLASPLSWGKKVGATEISIVKNLLFAFPLVRQPPLWEKEIQTLKACSLVKRITMDWPLRPGG